MATSDLIHRSGAVASSRMALDAGPHAGPAAAADPQPESGRGVTTCCLINHYQYGAFVGEAIRSVLDQTHALDEIILVDDGSEDGSLEVLRRICSQYPKVRLIAKGNGGQLSCFQSGLDASTADLVFFLDADDVWEPGYVEAVVALLERRPDVDFVATNERRFFEDGRSEVTEAPDRDLGYSIAQSLVGGGTFVGQPTSCLAIRRGILDQIFPLDGARGWRTCADEALVYGSSLVGAHKYFLGAPLVRYRIHGDNHFFGREYDPKDRLLRSLEVHRLVETLRKRHDLPESLASLSHHEFRTIENPTRAEYRAYRRLIAGSDLLPHRRRRVAWAVWLWYRFRRRG